MRRGDILPNITKIEVQKNHTERFNIYIDEQFAMGISIDTLVHFNLKKGDCIDNSKIQEIELKEYEQHAINEAIQFLSYRKRSGHEIEHHLEQKGYASTVISSALHYCDKHQLIDDNDYAESLKNTMIHTTDKGPEIYRQKLVKAGIDKQIIEKAVQSYVIEQPFQHVVKVARKIANQKKGPAVKVKQKVYQALHQKGYHFETIESVIQELDFNQDPEFVDNLLQRDLEKVYNKYQKKFDGFQLIQKTTDALLRKGYAFDDIKRKLAESGIEDE